jgi:hypothetical protein
MDDSSLRPEMARYSHHAGRPNTTANEIMMYKSITIPATSFDDLLENYSRYIVLQ